MINWILCYFSPKNILRGKQKLFKSSEEISVRSPPSPNLLLHQSSIPKIVGVFPKNKEPLKGQGAHLVSPVLLQSWPSSEPSTSVPHPNTLPRQQYFWTLSVTSGSLCHPFDQFSLFSPFQLLPFYFDVLTFPGLLPFLVQVFVDAVTGRNEQ